MTKTLKEFKNTIMLGMNVRIHKFEKTHVDNHSVIKDIGVPPKLQGIGFISKINSVGFYVTRLVDGKEVASFCNWPKASELYFVGNTFIITHFREDKTIDQRRTYQIIED